MTPGTASESRADGTGNLPPRGLPWKRRREVQHDAAHRLRDPHRDLDQPLAQRGGLRRRARRAGGVLPERLHQDVGRRGEQEAELMAEKPRTAQAIQGQAGLTLTVRPAEEWEVAQ